MKYKVGDKVKIVSLQSVGRGCCMDVVGDIGEIIEYDSSNILKYKVKIEDGGIWWWEESNLELIEDTKPNTSVGETEMNATKVENTTSKFKKGDIVIRTGYSYEDGRMIRGNHYVVHSCIGSIVYLEDVYNRGGKLGCFRENNFDLVKSYEDKPSTKFKKGDKVIRVGGTSALGANFGRVYTVDNPSSHSGFYWGELHNHVTLVEVENKPSDKYLELYVEQRNYREMNPNDLITISVDGVESEVPLGDIVHAVTILGVTNGCYGVDIWKALRKPFDCEGFVQDMGTVFEFRAKENEALYYFFQPYYDKQQQEKDELKTLIEDKMKEVDALVKQLKEKQK